MALRTATRNTGTSVHFGNDFDFGANQYQYISRMSNEYTPQNHLQRLMSIPSQPFRRESLDDDGRSFKKPRASRPKVKSGCVTCKTRRVKCDETKPQCLRCQKFGRKCDGYAPDPPSSRALIQLQPRIPAANIHGINVSIHVTEAESRYFQIFAERTAFELPGFYEPTFWTQIVLQESHNVVAIKHAVCALGALTKSMETAPGPQLKVNVIQDIDKKHHEQAVFQHIKAIQALNQYISSSQGPQLRNALIACLLFVCFETFQGSYASSVQQTYGGLKILRNYYVGTPGSRPWIPGKPPLQSLKSAGRGKISQTSQTLLERNGCHALFKERAIAMHVEEYLNHETEAHSRLEERRESLHRDQKNHNFIGKSTTMYDPSIEHVKIPSMGGTDLNQEQQQNLSLRTPNKQTRAQSDENPISTSTQSLSSPWYAANATWKSSESSSSLVSTPTIYTPPSTGPPTPSPSSYFAHQTSSVSTFKSTSSSSSLKRPLASLSPTPSSSPSLHNDLTIESVLIQSFVRLDGQGLFFGMTPGIPPLIWDIHKVFHLPIPPLFPSFLEAQRCWDFLMDRALQFYRRTAFNRAYAPLATDTPAMIAKMLATHLRAVSEFSKSFQPFLDSAVSPEGKVLNPAALVLSLYPKCVVIMLSTIEKNTEMVYDSFLSDFQYIVKTCAIIIAGEDQNQMPRNRRFSFDVGIVPALHVTATKCRNPVVRRKAIDLLFASPRQEGMWDGVLSARIGRWIVGCEEDGLEPPVLEEGTGDKMENETDPETSSGYPSPPDVVDQEGHGGGWQDGEKISDVVNAAVGEGGADFRRNGVGSLGSGSSNLARGTVVNKASSIPVPESKGWVVPEENRVQLMVVDFHIPERYIKVKCQKTLPKKDGMKEERETVIAW